MAESTRFISLKNRLDQLRRTMLPRTFSPTGTYTAIQLDKVRGYRLLVHAEIEAFLEDSAREVVRSTFDSWRRDFKPRITIVSLLAFLRPCDKSFKSVSEAVGFSVEQFNRAVERNNGIKEDNLMKILPPAGIAWANINETWLSTLNSFGTARGEVAHASVHVHQPIDPKSEFETIHIRILPGLKDLDEELQKLLE